MNNRILVKQLLETTPITRNDTKIFVSEYLKQFHCRNEFERAIIERVINEAPNIGSLVRTKSYLQNTNKEYTPIKEETDPITEDKPQKQNTFCLFLSQIYKKLKTLFTKK